MTEHEKKKRRAGIWNKYAAPAVEIILQTCAGGICGAGVWFVVWIIKTLLF